MVAHIRRLKGGGKGSIDGWLGGSACFTFFFNKLANRISLNVVLCYIGFDLGKCLSERGINQIERFGDGGSDVEVQGEEGMRKVSV